uniref:TIR domain-containing protein n=1 Tax=Macrostomum lignano TaxID=282301 RepID=A0A1I8HC31_9PLAT
MGKLVLRRASVHGDGPCAGGDHRERLPAGLPVPGRAAPRASSGPAGAHRAATVEEDGEAELGSTLLAVTGSWLRRLLHRLVPDPRLNLFEDYVHKTESRVANNLERISLMLEQLHLSIVCLYSEHDTDRELADELLTVMEQHSRPVRLVFQSEHPTEWSGKCSRSSRASSATSGRTSLLGLSRSVSVAETEDTEAKN